jgi:hypothetical protein
MYRKDSKFRSGPSKSFIALLSGAILLVIGGSIIIMNRSNGENYTATTPDTTNEQGGTVAVLAQANARRTAGATENTPSATEPTPQFYTFTMPVGFSAPTVVEEKSSCGENTVRKSTSVSGSISLTLYENGKPNDCDPSIIGDATLSLSKTEQNALVVQNKEQVSFCTKEQNPACPRGDGRLTLHFTTTESIEALKDTLYVVIEDTAIQPDLNAQAQQLVGIVEQIQLQ